MTHELPVSPAWLYEIEPIGWTHVQRPRENALERVLDTAWAELLRIHMPFVQADEERARLIAAFQSIEEIFLRDTDLRPYYDEAYLAIKPTASAVVDLSRVRHVIMLQSQLMERVFFALQLNRYANAPANRGWMNLFRRWGGSLTFNTGFDRLRPLLGMQLVHFYDNYIRYYNKTIDVLPVRHPWDGRLQPDRPPLESDDVQKERDDELAYLNIDVQRRRFEVPGVFLDSGIVEMPDTFSDFSETPDAPGGLSKGADFTVVAEAVQAPPPPPNDTPANA